VKLIVTVVIVGPWVVHHFVVSYLWLVSPVILVFVEPLFGYVIYVMFKSLKQIDVIMTLCCN
jgi:hypothetical protein